MSDTEWPEERMDRIGQTGPTGEHYDVVLDDDDEQYMFVIDDAANDNEEE